MSAIIVFAEGGFSDAVERLGDQKDWWANHDGIVDILEKLKTELEDESHRDFDHDGDGWDSMEGSADDVSILLSCRSSKLEGGRGAEAFRSMAKGVGACVVEGDDREKMYMIGHKICAGVDRDALSLYQKVVTEADLLGNDTAIINPSKRTMVIFIRAMRPGASKREAARDHTTALPNPMLPSGSTIMLNVRNTNASCFSLIGTPNADGGKHNHPVSISERQPEMNLARMAHRAYV